MKKFISFLFVTLLCSITAFSHTLATFDISGDYDIVYQNDPNPIMPQPILVTLDIESNDDNALPNETLQLVIFLDGQSSLFSTHLSLNTNGGWLKFSGIRPWEYGISTVQLDMNGYTPTGEFLLEGIFPNEFPPDGMAFGVFWKDIDGNILFANSKSTEFQSVYYPDYVGSWPFTFSAPEYAELLYMVTTNDGVKQSIPIITGARLIPDDCIIELW